MADSEGRPREVVAEGVPRLRLAKFVPAPAARRPMLARLGIAALGGAIALLFLVLLGAHALQTATGWLHRQPTYQVDFRAIELDPLPPAWYRWGAAGFLERVRVSAEEPETLSTLDLDLARLVLSFQRYGWVKKVVGARIEHPNRVVIRLVYREPVARFYESHEFALDKDGVVLPRDDIDWVAAEPLIELYEMTPPSDPRPGLICRPSSADGGFAPEDGRVLAASKMAAFLKSCLVRDGGDASALRFIVHPTVHNGLYVECCRNLMFHWGEAPGEEAPGELSAEAKWTWLRDSVKRLGTSEGRKPLYLYPPKASVVRTKAPVP
jgi:hypothetical protein